MSVPTRPPEGSVLRRIRGQDTMVKQDVAYSCPPQKFITPYRDILYRVMRLYGMDHLLTSTHHTGQQSIVIDVRVSGNTELSYPALTTTSLLLRDSRLLAASHDW